MNRGRDEPLPLRGPPDPARVEEVRPAQPEEPPGFHREHVGALDEERPALGEEQLEPAEVDLGRVGLDLPEVRVHGRGQCEVTRQPVLEVGADARGRLGRAVERVGRVARCPLDACGHVGEDLELARGPEIAEVDERPEPADHPLLGREDRGPPRLLARPEVDPLEVDPPRLDGPAASEPELRERDSELGRPPPLVPAHGHVPDGVPRGVLVDVVEEEPVGPDTGRVDPEHESRPVVVV